jgi:hypothetical protein
MLGNLKIAGKCSNMFSSTLAIIIFSHVINSKSIFQNGNSLPSGITEIRENTSLTSEKPFIRFPLVTLV